VQKNVGLSALLPAICTVKIGRRLPFFIEKKISPTANPVSLLRRTFVCGDEI
jgi:hypothetical protein